MNINGIAFTFPCFMCVASRIGTSSFFSMGSLHTIYSCLWADKSMHTHTHSLPRILRPIPLRFSTFASKFSSAEMLINLVAFLSVLCHVPKKDEMSLQIEISSQAMVYGLYMLVEQFRLTGVPFVVFAIASWDLFLHKSSVGSRAINFKVSCYIFFPFYFCLPIPSALTYFLVVLLNFLARYFFFIRSIIHPTLFVVAFPALVLTSSPFYRLSRLASVSAPCSASLHKLEKLSMFRQPSIWPR